MPASLGDALDQIVRQISLQITTSDEVVKRDIIREFIYKGAGLLTDATKIFPEVGYNDLDIKTEFNSNLDVDYPVAEGAEGGEGRIEWTPFYLSLEKAEGSFKITDEAKIRGYQNLQYQTGVKSLARAFARKKNLNILTRMVAGVGGSVATGGAWDGGTPKIVEDVSLAINTILESPVADIVMADLRNVVIALPIKAFNLAGALTTIANLKMSYKDYLKGQFPGIEFLPFKELSTSTGLGGGDDMYCIIAGRDTGKHGVFRGGQVPLTEEKRVGAATKHTVRQWFNTKVVPDSDSVATSSRIYAITAILGTP